MATETLSPTSRASGAQEVDPATRGGRDQRRGLPGRRVKPPAKDGGEESEPETEADATTRPHRLDVLA